jgi:hypothetical protein
MTQTVQYLRIFGRLQTPVLRHRVGHLASKAAKLRVKSKNKWKIFVDKGFPDLFMLS